MLGFRKKRILGGVRFTVSRDEVEGKTFFQHRKHPSGCKSPGFFPYIGRQDQGAVWLVCRVNTGPARVKLTQPVTLLVNVDGELFTIGVLENRWINNPMDGICWNYVEDSLADDFVPVLQKMARSTSTLVRLRSQYGLCDFELKNWNRRLLHDVLAGYRAVAPKAVPTSNASGAPRRAAPDAALGLGGDSGPIPYGSLLLHPDGSISDLDQEIRLPVGVEVSGLAMGEAVLESLDAAGYRAAGYRLTTPEGGEEELRYTDGRWTKRTRGGGGDHA